jgi:hypothetical protein
MLRPIHMLRKAPEADKLDDVTQLSSALTMLIPYVGSMALSERRACHVQGASLSAMAPAASWRSIRSGRS